MAVAARPLEALLLLLWLAGAAADGAPGGRHPQPRRTEYYRSRYPHLAPGRYQDPQRSRYQERHQDSATSRHQEPQRNRHRDRHQDSTASRHQDPQRSRYQERHQKPQRNRNQDPQRNTYQGKYQGSAASRHQDPQHNRYQDPQSSRYQERRQYSAASRYQDPQRNRHQDRPESLHQDPHDSRNQDPRRRRPYPGTEQASADTDTADRRGSPADVSRRQQPDAPAGGGGGHGGRLGPHRTGEAAGARDSAMSVRERASVWSDINAGAAEPRQNDTVLGETGGVGDAEWSVNDIEDAGAEHGVQTPRDPPRNSKFLFLPLFTLVRFSNSACESSEPAGFTATGTCYLPSECSGRGGLARGSCAMGFGVCCVFTLSCGGSTDQNGTFFVNPEYPDTGTTARSCVFSVQKSFPDVTQIRLDFLQFEMSAPSEGSCNTDVFSVSGQNTNADVPAICGLNSGQHMYLEVGERSGPIQLRAVTSSGSIPHRWRVKVTQYRRPDPARAPAHCLQYFTGKLGQIESFNYPAVGDAAGYLNRLNYMICIRKESGFCSITYSVDRFDRFSLPEVFDIFNVRITMIGGTEVATATVPAGQAGIGPTQCTEDYILLSADRLCGDRLNDGTVNSLLTENADVTDNSGGQFNVKFVTGEGTVGRGFRLYYRQNPCRSRRT